MKKLKPSLKPFGLLALSLMITAIVHASPSLPELNANHIHQLYRDGEFSQVVVALTQFERAKASGFHKNDSLIVAKYLGVIFCANPETRERGRGYFFRLMALDSEADLAAMLVSEEIDKAFEKVRKEFRAIHPNYHSTTTKSQTSNSIRSAEWKKDTAPERKGKPVTNPIATRKPEASKASGSGFPWITTGIGAVVVGAGVTTYFILAQSGKDPAPEQETIRIPKAQP